MRILGTDDAPLIPDCLLVLFLKLNQTKVTKNGGRRYNIPHEPIHIILNSTCTSCSCWKDASFFASEDINTRRDFKETGWNKFNFLQNKELGWSLGVTYTMHCMPVTIGLLQPNIMCNQRILMTTGKCTLIIFVPTFKLQIRTLLSLFKNWKSIAELSSGFSFLAFM